MKDNRPVTYVIHPTHKRKEAQRKRLKRRKKTKPTSKRKK